MSRREELANQLRRDNSGYRCGLLDVWNMSIRQIIKKFRQKAKKNGKK